MSGIKTEPLTATVAELGLEKKQAAAVQEQSYQQQLQLMDKQRLSSRLNCDTSREKRQMYRNISKRDICL